DKSNIGIAKYYLQVFKDQGFYVADISKVDVKLQRLDQNTCDTAIAKLNDLTESGLTPKRIQELVKEEEQVRKDTFMLNRLTRRGLRLLVRLRFAAMLCPGLNH